jgi:hypothetical protein
MTPPPDLPTLSSSEKSTQIGALLVLSGTILQSDETFVRVGKRTFWTWVFHHGDSACFLIRPSRGKTVVEAFLGDIRPEVWVSDRLAAQMGWATAEHQVCLAHLARHRRLARSSPPTAALVASWYTRSTGSDAKDGDAWESLQPCTLTQHPTRADSRVRPAKRRVWPGDRRGMPQCRS